MARKVEFMKHRPVSSRSTMKIPRTTRSARPKVVLAYSGGLDTSLILHWLKEEICVKLRFPHASRKCGL